MNPPGNFIERLHAKSQLHSLGRAKLVDQDLGPWLTFDGFKEQRRSAWFGITLKCRLILATRLRDSVGNLGDLEDGVYFHLDAAQLSGAFERGNPLSEVVVGHWEALRTEATLYIGGDSRNISTVLS